MLITFEGIEGSGKTTQIELLYHHLKQAGHDVIKTREPGGTAFGEALRKIFLHENLNVLPLSELMIFMAMRAQHVEELILPALKNGKVVLCDRFVDASYAYQGYGRGIDLGIIETLNRLVTKGVRPNLTILLDCTAKKGLKRKAAFNNVMDRFEKEDLAFHRRIKDAYLKLSREEPKRFLVIDGAESIENIEALIRKNVENLLKNYGI
ncbi:MAG TPA: dTMP kinase [Syntrophorhabdaceae bacterium]|nr:dTMP kinase [Syntrophorhabdaceae bacterium]HNT67749.1 dTMP kinase [Syntrophorhabdaceae bacterium]